MPVKIINALVDNLDEIGATDGHFTLNNIKHTRNLTAVMSVYQECKPAHMVLDELYEWSLENNHEVRDLIKSIQSDMTWNDEVPVKEKNE